MIDLIFTIFMALLVALLGLSIIEFIFNGFSNICWHEYGKWEKEDEHHDVRYCKNCEKRQRRNIN